MQSKQRFDATQQRFDTTQAEAKTVQMKIDAIQMQLEENQNSLTRMFEEAAQMNRETRALKAKANKSVDEEHRVAELEESLTMRQRVTQNLVSTIARQVVE